MFGVIQAPDKIHTHPYSFLYIYREREKHFLHYRITYICHVFKSLLTMMTHHQTADKLYIWLHIPSQMTNVLNLYRCFALKFLYIDIMLIYDILVFCLDFCLLLETLLPFCISEVGWLVD